MNFKQLAALATLTTLAGACEPKVYDTSDAIGAGDECTALVDGDWTASGSAFGMAMGMTVAMDVEGCTFTIDDWSMAMGSLPDAGQVNMDEVGLSSADDSYWATCTGTVNEDGTEASGVCSGDGGAWSLIAD